MGRSADANEHAEHKCRKDMISNRRLAPIAAALLALFLNFSRVWGWDHVAAVWIAVIIVGLYLFDLLASQSVIWIPGLAMAGLMATGVVPPMPSTEPAALVTLGRKDGTIGEMILPQAPGGNAGIRIYFHNHGPGLARRFNVGFLGSEDAPFAHMARTKNLKDGSIHKSGGQQAIIGPDSDCPITLVLSADRAARMLNGSKYVGDLWFPWGMFEYCAKSGEYRCQPFELWFLGPPSDRFDLRAVGLVGQSSSANYSSRCMPPFYALPPDPPGQESLRPCDDLDEQ